VSLPTPPPATTPLAALRAAVGGTLATLRAIPSERRRARALRTERLAQRVGPLPVWGWLLLLSAVGLLVRLYYFGVQDGMHYPDELFQYLEPATSHRTGHGWLAWEFTRGARNWLVPWHYGALMELFGALGLEGHGLLRAIWLHNAVLATLLVPLGFRLGYATARGDLRAGVLTAAACAAFPLLGYFAPHTLAEWHGLLLVTWAYVLWLEHVRWPDAPGRLSAAFLVGLLLGGVFIARFGLLVFLPLPLLDYTLRGRVKELFAALAGLFVALALLGLADLAMWGKPFHSVIEYVKFNWVEGGAARLEVKPTLWYWQTAFVERLGPAIWLAVIPMLAYFHRHWRVLLGWLVPLVLLSKVGIKQERFLMPLWPFFLAATVSGWLALADRVAAAPRLARVRERLPMVAGSIALLLVVASNFAGTAALEPRLRAGMYLAQDWVGDQPDATGVLIDGPFHMNGGHTLLHKNIPELGYSPDRLAAPVFSHVITESEHLAARLARSGELEEVASFEQGVKVFRKRLRLVGVDPDALPARILREAGGGGGAPSELTCPDGAPLVGVEVRRGPRALAAVRPLCETSGPDATPGAWLGGQDEGTTQPSRCRAGERVIGFHGRSGALVDALGVTCARGDGPAHRAPARGGRGGAPFELSCPDGYAATGFSARTGDALDAVGLVCTR